MVFAQNNKEERSQIANAIENSILHEMLNKWYPQNMDTSYGGFLTEFTYDFKPTSNQNKICYLRKQGTT
jgi:mannobiose 2-epimerase